MCHVDLSIYCPGCAIVIILGLIRSNLIDPYQSAFLHHLHLFHKIKVYSIKGANNLWWLIKLWWMTQKTTQKQGGEKGGADQEGLSCSGHVRTLSDAIVQTHSDSGSFHKYFLWTPPDLVLINGEVRGHRFLLSSCRWHWLQVGVSKKGSSSPVLWKRSTLAFRSTQHCKQQRTAPLSVAVISVLRHRNKVAILTTYLQLQLY